MPDELTRLLDYWPEWSPWILIFLYLFRSQLAVLVPQVIKDYFTEKARLRADRQEYEQSLRTQQANLTRLKEMSAMSSLSFTEEQLTQMAAENQVQLSEAYNFIRTVIVDYLKIIIEKQNFILTELRKLNGEKDSGLTNADTQEIRRAD